MAKNEKVVKIAYTKKVILNHKKYRKRKDILNVLLQENKEYTFEQVDSFLNNFYKKVVE